MVVDPSWEEREPEAVDVERWKRPWARNRGGVRRTFMLPDLRVVIEGEAVPEIVVELEPRTDRDRQRQVAGHDIDVFPGFRRLEHVVGREPDQIVLNLCARWSPQ